MQEPVETTELQYHQEHSAKNGPFLGPLTSRSLLFPRDCSPIPHLVVCSASRRLSIPNSPRATPSTWWAISFATSPSIVPTPGYVPNPIATNSPGAHESIP